MHRTTGARRPRPGRHGAALLILAAALAPCPAAAAERYVAAILASWHIGDDSLNDVTPGIALGWRWAAARWPVEYHVEGGVFYNSYEEVSPLLIAGVSGRVARLGAGELRLGASAGIARYEALSADLEDRYGIPNVDGYIPIALATAEYRLRDTSVRLTAAPPGEGVTAILNLSLARRF